MPANKKISVSVALCTYNGEKFIKEQLESYSHQVQLPDELVICDDCSADGTIRIIESFRDDAPFDIRLEINPRRLGSTKNFERAINLCKGDAIFLSDQDDWWYPEKIQSLVQHLSSPKKYGAVFSDAEIVDDTLRSQNRTLWESIGFNRNKRKKFVRGGSVPVLLKENVVTGATMAFDASFKDILLPIPDVWVHDAWIALLLSFKSDLKMVEKPLIKYRQHVTQQIGVKGHSLSQKMNAARNNKKNVYEKEAECYKMVYNRVIGFGINIQDPAAVDKLKDKIHHIETRAGMKNNDFSRVTVPMKELIRGRYHKYSFGWHSFLKDLIFGH